MNESVIIVIFLVNTVDALTINNLKSYDSHLVLRKANEFNDKLNRNKEIAVIVRNSEKFITCSFVCHLFSVQGQLFILVSFT